MDPLTQTPCKMMMLSIIWISGASPPPDLAARRAKTTTCTWCIMFRMDWSGVGGVGSPLTTNTVNRPNNGRSTTYLTHLGASTPDWLSRKLLFYPLLRLQRLRRDHPEWSWRQCHCRICFGGGHCYHAAPDTVEAAQRMRASCPGLDWRLENVL